MKIYRAITLLFCALLLLFVVPVASAHRPAEAGEEAITQIPSATTSYAYYQAIEAADQVDIYAISGAKNLDFHAGINIPQIEGLEDYGVSMALLGPGLPALNNADLPNLNAYSTSNGVSLAAAVASGDFGGIIRSSSPSEAFFEPFTQTNYWGRQSLDIALRQAGTHYLVIWQPDGALGKYVLDTGREEVFGPTDLFRFPLWWIDVRLYFEQTATVALAALSGGISLLFILGAGVRTGYSFIQERRADAAVAT